MLFSQGYKILDICQWFLTALIRQTNKVAGKVLPSHPPSEFVAIDVDSRTHMTTIPLAALKYCTV